MSLHNVTRETVHNMVSGSNQKKKSQYKIQHLCKYSSLHSTVSKPYHSFANGNSTISPFYRRKKYSKNLKIVFFYSIFKELLNHTIHLMLIYSILEGCCINVRITCCLYAYTSGNFQICLKNELKRGFEIF